MKSGEWKANIKYSQSWEKELEGGPRIQTGHSTATQHRTLQLEVCEEDIESETPVNKVHASETLFLAQEEAGYFLIWLAVVGMADGSQ